MGCLGGEEVSDCWQHAGCEVRRMIDQGFGDASGEELRMAECSARVKR